MSELEIDEREEAEALGRIAHAIASYRHDANGEISRWEASAARLARKYNCAGEGGRNDDDSGDGDDDGNEAKKHRRRRRYASLLGRLGDKCRAARAAAERNARWLDALLEATVGLRLSGSSIGNGDDENEDNNDGSSSTSSCSPYAPAAAAFARSLAAAGRLPPPGDADKVRYVLKNAARDWSAEGKGERDASYGRIVEALSKALPAERGSRVKDGEEGEEGKGSTSPFSPLPPPPPPRVLVPGAGLGRLCIDLVDAGYAAQGNEFSYYMLLASAFALNFCCGASGEESENGENDNGENGNGEQEERKNDDDADLRPIIHPWVLTPCNWLRDADQLAGVRVPDVDPAGVVAAAEARRQERWRRRLLEEEDDERKNNGGGGGGDGGDGDGEDKEKARRQRDEGEAKPPSLPPSIPDHPRHSFPLLSMVAGDFAQVYRHGSRESTFDAVATCFFVDTARDILSYIETIRHVLIKDGTGVWVNLGPLLYHWAEAASYLPQNGGEGDEEEDTSSIELPLEEVLLAVAGAGFEIVDLKTNVPATFNATPRSMLRSGYACAQWTAVLKKEEAEVKE